MKPKISMREALADEALLGGILAGESWRAWRVLLIAAMGEKLTADERKLFRQLTGRSREPLQRCDELTAIVGRRGGKSRAIATLATYIAGLCDHPELVRGETGVFLIVAPDQRQAAVTFGYVVAAFEASPMLSSLLTPRGTTAETLTLTTGIRVEVRSSNFRTLRAPTYIGGVVEEAGFLFTAEGAANADVEIVKSIRPGLATTRGPLVIASSPYARRGILWDAYRRDYGANGDPLCLVAKGASRDFNPSLSKRVVDRAYERDAAAAAAEYGGEFRSDIEAFVSREAVEAAVVSGRFELPYQRGVQYIAAVDPSGGSVDSMTLAISHRDAEGRGVLDAIRRVHPPFSPDAVVAEFAHLMKSIFHINRCIGDHYAGAWPIEAFAKHGVTYEPSAKAKSDLYRDLLPLINSGRIELLDDARLVNETCGLERKTARSGKDSIDHAPGQHDDVVNAVALALTQVTVNAAPVGICALLSDPKIAARAGLGGGNMGNPVQFGPNGEIGERLRLQMLRSGRDGVEWGDLGAGGRCRR